MSSRGIVVGAVAAALLMVPGGLPAQATPSNRGSLEVVAAGVPAGKSAKIVVAGKKYRKKISTSGKLRNLRPGTYRVWATPIVVDGGTAAVPNQPVRVTVRKRAKATLRLDYLWNPRTDSYPPSPARDVRLTDRTVSTISLGWINGSAPDLAEIAVRRRLGAVAPNALDDGRVVPMDGRSNQVTDTGLRPNTVYSYSVFMVDAAGNASAAASITVRTKGEAVAMTAGLAHTCALLVDQQDRLEVDTSASEKQVVCWGANDSGQLGDGSRTDAATPRTVQLNSPIKVVAGGNHTCALVQSGGLWCWGANGDGQLGDGSTEDSSTPVRADVQNVKDVAVGISHTCAVRFGGEVLCWGANERGQLGRPASEREPEADTVSGLDAVDKVTAGYQHTCALSGSDVFCWGSNESGQLGDRSTSDSDAPVKSAVDSVQAISAGVGHTCADVRGGTLVCWGANQFGQLGDGTTTDRSEPVPTSMREVSLLSAGAYHTCAVAGAQSRCWGRNSTGRIGDGTTVDRLTPVRVSGLQQVSSIAAGGYHSCAVAGGGALCWGANGKGQLGFADPLGSLRPLAVDGL